MSNKNGKIHFAELEIGWWKDEDVKPPVMYYIGHPNHWNTSKFSELMKELNERTDWPEELVAEILTEMSFPVQN